MSLLLKLFARHFADPIGASARFARNLDRVALPFDVLGRLREVEFPPYPGFNQGMPSWIYYFVPGTRWGTFCKKSLTQPTDPDFVYEADGSGLNLGCPVRLAIALELVFSISEAEREECLQGLAAPTKHLATVEELLWLSVWAGATQVRRGGIIPGNNSKKNVDWFLVVQGVPIFLETKFRPADWPRLSDKNTHGPMDGFLLGKAGEQFPRQKPTLCRYFVGLTGFADPNSFFASLCEEELAKHYHIDGILFKTLLGSVHIFTRYESVLYETKPLIAKRAVEELPWFYSIPIHRRRREERILARGAKVMRPNKSGEIWYGRIVPLPPAIPLDAPPDPYHMRIVKYLDDGEPVFETITKRIWVPVNEVSQTRPAAKEQVSA